jgi:hypothetical protein
MSNNFKNNQFFKEEIKKTKTFQNFEKFKQLITLKATNVIHLYHKYHIAKLHGIEKLKENKSILVNDIKIIEEILKKEYYGK